jgi:hypothetical protein
MRRLAAVVFVVATLTACGTATVGTTAPPSCHSNGDCKTGQSCQFAVYGSCDGTGACLPDPDGSACIPQTACTCGGATETVCLVNGNSPSPVSSLGSCDGALQQTVFDASTGGSDANPPPPEASDDATLPMDSSTDDSAIAPDTSPPPVDASSADADDAASMTTLGSPCTADAQCTDPQYPDCKEVAGTKICSAPCMFDFDCEPPSNGFCDTDGYCDVQ